MERHESISPAEAHALLRGGHPVEILDVREPDEYRRAHVHPSRLIPLGQLASRTGELDPSKTLLMLCRSGSRSALAARILAERGFDVRNIGGGILAWIAGKLPLAAGE